MLLLVVAAYAELEALGLHLAKSLMMLPHGKKLFGQPAHGKLGVAGHKQKFLTFHGSVLAMYVWITYIVSTLALTSINLLAFCTSCATTSWTMSQPPIWGHCGTGFRNFMLNKTQATDTNI